MQKRTFRIILNILIAGGVCAVLANIITGSQTGMLAASGLKTFRYFTTLSNVWEALAALALVISALSRKDRTVPAAVEVIKYIAAAQIFVTFITVVAFLGPIYGYAATCSGNNFWFHLVIPTAAILEQIFISERRIGIKENVYAAFPPLIYGCFYALNIVINGKGEWPNTNDWYGFLNWGVPVGLIIFAVICLIAFLLGLLLRGLWKAAHRNAV